MMYPDDLSRSMLCLIEGCLSANCRRCGKANYQYMGYLGAVARWAKAWGVSHKEAERRIEESTAHKGQKRGKDMEQQDEEALTTPKVWNRRDPNCPKDAVYVGRPSRWGNPYKIGKHGNREQVISLFRDYVEGAIRMHDGRLTPSLEQLRGKDLVCWCAPLPCHADVLLEVANT